MVPLFHTPFRRSQSLADKTSLDYDGYGNVSADEDIECDEINDIPNN
jgi:hypothetical protein